MAIRKQLVVHQHEGIELHGMLVRDEAHTAARPCIIISHAWGGRGDNELKKAEALAQLGYCAFALDLYGGGKCGSSKEENAALMGQFIDDRQLLRARMAVVLEAVRGLEAVDARRVAAIGYCFGGLCVLDLARSGAQLDGVASFHGLLDPAEGIPTDQIRAKVLVLHGHDDPMVPVEKVTALEDELSSAGADWQLHTYGNTMHAFTNPIANDPGFGTVYDAAADRRSWYSLRGFLEELWPGVV